MLRTTRARVLTRARWRVVMVMAFVTLTLGVLASSSAGVQLPPSLGTPLSDTEQLVNGLAGDLFSTVTGDVCSAAESAPLGPLTPVACELQFLQFNFHTVYRAPGGKLVTLDHFALPLVPTPIDITGDGIPDALATVYISSVNAATLQITRLPTAPKSMPAEVELVIRDPSNPSSSERIAAGYDALSSNAPGNFGATLSLLGIAPLQLGLNVKVTTPGSDLALVGSLYSQQPGGTQQVQANARLDYSPVPAAFGYNLLLASQHQHVTATASSASTVTASVSLVNGSDTQTINGTINKLPTRVDVDVINDSPTQRQATYTASASIAHVDATYQDATQLSGGGSQINTQIVAHLVSLPKGVMFQQTAARVFSVTTTGGAIGSLDGGFATGEALTDVPGTGSGAYVDASGAQLSAAVRLAGLQSADVDFSDPYKVDLVSEKQPLSITDIDGESGRTITGQVNDLPAHLTLTLDPDNGKISENGYGEGISSITAHMTATEPFAGPISRIAGTLTGIPSSFNLSYSYASGSFSGTLDNPIGEVQLNADDGTHSTTVPGNDSGLGLIDKPNDFALAAVVYGLKSLSFATKPLDVALTSAGGHVWNVSADYQSDASGPEITATAVIDQMPATAEVKLVPAASSGTTDVDYIGTSKITHIGIDVNQPGTPFMLTATHIHADLDTIPTGFDLHFSDASGTIVASIDNPIGEIQANLDDGSHTVSVPGPSTQSGLDLLDSGGQFAVAGRIFGLKSITYTKSPMEMAFQTTQKQVFNIGAKVDVSNFTTTATGTLNELPDSADIKFAPGANDTSGTVSYTGDQIGEITMEATTSQPLLMNADHAKVDLTSIPGNFNLSFADKSGSVTASMDHPVGEIQFSLDDGNPADEVTAPGSDSGVAILDSGGKFAVAGTIFGLSDVSYQKSPMAFSITSAADHTFNFAATADIAGGTTTASGEIDKLPSTLSLSLTPDGSGSTQVSYNASSTIDHIHLDATSPTPYFASADHIHADLYGLPKDLTLNAGLTNGEFQASTNDQISAMVFTASQDDQGPLLIGTDGNQVTGPTGYIAPIGTDAAYLMDEPGRFVAAAQVFGMQSVDVGTSPVKIAVSSEGSHELLAGVDVTDPQDPSGNSNLHINADVNQLPPDFSFKLEKGSDGGMTATYTANAAITSIKADIRADSVPLIGSVQSGVTQYLPDEIYGEIDGLPATDPSSPLVVTIPAQSSGPLFTLDNGGRTIQRVVFDALRQSEVPSGTLWSQAPALVPEANPQGAPDDSTGDGAYVVDDSVPTGGGNSYMYNFEAHVALDGLRGATIQTTPSITANLDVDENDAQPFGINVEMNPNGDDPDTSQTVTGYINKPTGNMQMSMSHGMPIQMTYSGESPISGIDLHMKQLGLSEMNLNIANIPTKMNLCLATGAAAGTTAAPGPCDRAYPPAITSVPDSTVGHSVVVNVDDDGTSNGLPPITVNGYFCLTSVTATSTFCDPPTGADQAWDPDNDPPWVYQSSLGWNTNNPDFIAIHDLEIHNLFMDVYNNSCGGPLVFCGHLWMDTRNQPVSGTVVYYTTQTSGTYWLEAGAVFPSGFSVDNHYTEWDGAGDNLSQDELFGSYSPPATGDGSANCPSGTFVGARVAIVGGAKEVNLTPNYFC